MVWFKSTPSSKSSTWPFSELPQAPLCALVRWRGKGEEPASPRAPASPPAERRACKGLGMGLGQAREKFRFECRVSVLGGGCCAAQARNYHCAVCQPGYLGDCLRSTVPVLAEKNAVRIYHSAGAHSRTPSSELTGQSPDIRNRYSTVTDAIREHTPYWAINYSFGPRTKTEEAYCRFGVFSLPMTFISRRHSSRHTRTRHSRRAAPPAAPPARPRGPICISVYCHGV